MENKEEIISVLIKFLVNDINLNWHGQITYGANILSESMAKHIRQKATENKSVLENRLHNFVKECIDIDKAIEYFKNNDFDGSSINVIKNSL